MNTTSRFEWWTAQNTGYTNGVSWFDMFHDKRFTNRDEAFTAITEYKNENEAGHMAHYKKSSGMLYRLVHHTLINETDRRTHIEEWEEI